MDAYGAQFQAFRTCEDHFHTHIRILSFYTSEGTRLLSRDINGFPSLSLITKETAGLHHSHSNLYPLNKAKMVLKKIPPSSYFKTH